MVFSQARDGCLVLVTAGCWCLLLGRDVSRGKSLKGKVICNCLKCCLLHFLVLLSPWHLTFCAQKDRKWGKHYLLAGYPGFCSFCVHFSDSSSSLLLLHVFFDQRVLLPSGQSSHPTNWKSWKRPSMRPTILMYMLERCWP